MDELLAEGAIEPSSCCASFYSSMFVVPMHTGGLWPILNLKLFNHYMHVPSSKMPTIRHVWQLIQLGHYAFSIDLQDAYLHIYIVKHHHCFLQFVCLISGRFCPFGWPQPLGFSLPSLNLFCSLAITRVSVLLFIWMTSWSWFVPSGQVRGFAHFVFLISSAWITY